tara:strand:+ start:60 stop:866 length:807 start_codon:yes stop_codon:yes gene_type:complete
MSEGNILDHHVINTSLSFEAKNCLAQCNIIYVGQLVQYSVLDIVGIRGVGRGNLRKIINMLESKGLTLGMNTDWSSPSCYENDTKTQAEKTEVLEQHVSKIGLSVRSLNCLNAINVHNLGDLIKYTAEELSAVKNLGTKSLSEIINVLGSKNLKLKQPEEEESIVELTAKGRLTLKIPVSTSTINTQFKQLTRLHSVFTINVNDILSVTKDEIVFSHTATEWYQKSQRVSGSRFDSRSDDNESFFLNKDQYIIIQNAIKTYTELERSC